MIDAAKFKAAREAKGMKQGELAAAVGVKQQLISQIESGEVGTTKKIYLIAKALDVPASYLDTAIPAIEGDFADAISNAMQLPPEDQAMVLEQLNGFIEIIRKRRAKLSDVNGGQ